MILTVTLNPSIDLSCRCQHVSPDRKLRCTDSAVEPGGGGLNVSRVINELGGQGRALWLAGGESGERLNELIARAGVEGDAIRIAGEVRHNLYVAESASGRAYRFVLPGPEVGADELDAAVQRIEQAGNLDWLVLSGSLPPEAPADTYARMIEQSGAAKVVVDTSGPALREAAKAGPMLIKPNRRELAQLSGRDELAGDDDIAKAAREVIDAGQAEYVLVSLGAGGAMLVSDQQTLHVHAPTVKTRSPVGAGDSMVAGVVTGFARGYDPQHAARLGVAAGSAAAMTPGTQLCRREDVEQLFDRIQQQS